jgi:hypothetical protein
VTAGTPAVLLSVVPAALKGSGSRDTTFGYFLSCDEFTPAQLLDQAGHAADAGFTRRRLLKILLRGCRAAGQAALLRHGVAGARCQVLLVRVSPSLISRRRLRAAARWWSEMLLAMTPR